MRLVIPPDANKHHELLPIPVARIWREHVHKRACAVRKGADDKATLEGLLTKCFLEMEELVRVTFQATVAACAAADRADILELVIDVPHLESVGEGDKWLRVMSVERRDWAALSFGSCWDYMQRLGKAIRRAPEPERLPSFAREIAERLEKKPEELFERPDHDPSAARGAPRRGREHGLPTPSIDSAIKARNDQTHAKLPVDVPICCRWLEFLAFLAGEYFDVWQRHVIVVKKERAAYCARGKDVESTPTVIAPGHPLERLRRNEVVLFSPMPGHQRGTADDDAVDGALEDGVGEYVGLFPWLLYTEDVDDIILGALDRLHGGAGELEARSWYHEDRRFKVGGGHVCRDARQHLRALSTALSRPPGPGDPHPFRPEAIVPYARIEHRDVSPIIRYSAATSEQVEALRVFVSTGRRCASALPLTLRRHDQAVTLRLDRPRDANVRAVFDATAEDGFDEIVADDGDDPAVHGLEPDQLAVKVCTADDPLKQAMFLEEAYHTRRFLRDRCIVSVLEQGVITAPGVLRPISFYVMPRAQSDLAGARSARAQGRPLVPATRDDSTAPPSSLDDHLPHHLWVLRILNSVVQALDTVHGAELVHRDLKLENVLWFDRDITQLADLGSFGFRSHPGRSTAGTEIVTTWPYGAPELDANDPEPRRDPRVDVFSFGVLFYVLLVDFESARSTQQRSGRRSFAFDPDARKPVEHIDREMGLDPEAELSFTNVIARCTDREPGRRYESAARLRDALSALEVEVRVRVQRRVRELIGELRDVQARRVGRDPRQVLFDVLFGSPCAILNCVHEDTSKDGGAKAAPRCRFESDEALRDDLEGCLRQATDPAHAARFLELLERAVKRCPGVLYACDLGAHHDVRSVVKRLLKSRFAAAAPAERATSNPLPSDGPVDGDALGDCLLTLVQPLGRER